MECLQEKGNVYHTINNVNEWYDNPQQYDAVYDNNTQYDTSYDNIEKDNGGEFEGGSINGTFNKGKGKGKGKSKGKCQGKTCYAAHPLAPYHSVLCIEDIAGEFR